MNFQFYLEKLHDSEEYKKFMKENKDAFLCSGFFVKDFEGTDNKSHLDFWTGDKMFSFELHDGVKLVPVKVFDKTVPEKLGKVDVNFDEIEELIRNEMIKQDVNKKIQKIILSLQAKNQKQFIIATVFISGFGLLKICINIINKKIVSFEKKSFFDMLKITGKKKGGK